MQDSELQGKIDGLVEEEHRLQKAGEEEGGLSPEEHERLQHLQVELDRVWDLLRQRRARRSAGLDPDDASERDEGTVEGYLQ